MQAQSTGFQDAGLQTRALAYLDNLEEAADADTNTPTELLKSIQEAQQLKQSDRARRLLEILVAKDIGGFDSWLRLVRLWRDTNPGAPNALNAAYAAWMEARGEAQKIEAILLLGDIIHDTVSDLEEAVSAAERAYQEAVGDGSSKAEKDRLQDVSMAAVQETEAMRMVARLVQAEIGRRVSHDTLRVALMSKDLESRFRLEDVEDLRREWRDSQSEIAACAVFSMPLERNTSTVLANLTVQRYGNKAAARIGKDARSVPLQDRDISIDGKTLCVHGLKPGTYYSFDLATGLRSFANTPLAEKQRQWFRTRDFPAALGFEGNKYVLRKQGSTPLRSINIDTVDLEIFRITDRSLARQIATGIFNRRIPAATLKDFSSGLAQRIWQDTAVITASRNERAVTDIPLSAILQAHDTLRSRNVEESSHGVTVEGTSGRFHADPAREGKLRDGGLYALVATSAQARDGFTAPGEAERHPTQWFIESDIGLSLVRSKRDMHVVARSLGTADPLAGLKVELVSRSNRVLGEAKTNELGIARFPRSLTRGEDAFALGMVIAYGENDFNFVDATQPPLDLSGLDLPAKRTDTALDLYMTTERGVYRPGETVKTLLISRGPDGTAPAQPEPVMLQVKVGDRTVVNPVAVAPSAWKAGGALVELPIPTTSSLGAARIVASLGKEGDILATETFTIDFFEPDTVRVAGSAPTHVSVTDTGTAKHIAIEGEVRASYLFGSEAEQPASDLSAEAWVRIEARNALLDPCYARYVFGDATSTPPPVMRRVKPAAKTDAAGRLTIATVIENIPDEYIPSQVEVTVEMRDAISKVGRTAAPLRDEVPHGRPLIGARFVSALSPRPGQIGQIALAALDPAGKPQAGVPVVYSLSRETTDYFWSEDELEWTAQPRSLREPIMLGRNGRIEENVTLARRSPDAAGCHPPGAVIDLPPLAPGSYVFHAQREDEDAKTVSVFRFDVGHAGLPHVRKPELFSLRLEKDVFEPGEPIPVQIDNLSIGTGTVLVAAASETGILDWKSVSRQNGNSLNITFETAESWRGGVYIFATAFRANDLSEGVGTARAVAASFARVEGFHDQLDVSFAAPMLSIHPSGEGIPLEVEIDVDNADPDEATYVAVGLVDEGIWRLTGFTVDRPAAYFNAKGALPLDVIDLYDHLLRSQKDGRGAGGQGGDISGRTSSGLRSRGVLAFLEMQAVGEDGSARFSFPSGTFIGSGKLFAIAWSDDRTGFAERSITMREKAWATLTAPGRLSPGDKAQSVISVRMLTDADETTEEAPLNIELRVDGARDNTISGPLQVDGRLWNGTFEITAPLDRGAVDVSAKLFDNDFIQIGKERVWSIPVGPPQHPHTPPAVLVALDGIGAGEARVLDRAELGEGARLQDGFTLKKLILAKRAYAAPSTLSDIGKDRSFRAAASTLSLVIADLTAGRAPPVAPEKALSNVIAMQSGSGRFEASPDYSRRDDGEALWRSAYGLDLLLGMRERGEEVEDQFIEAGIGYLLGELRDRDFDDFCRPDVYFAMIALTRAAKITDQLQFQLERCGRNPNETGFALAMRTAARGAAGTATPEDINKAIATWDTSTVGTLTDAITAITLLGEGGADQGQIDTLIEAALDRSEPITQETAVWFARLGSNLERTFGQSALHEDSIRLTDTLHMAQGRDGTLELIPARGTEAWQDAAIENLTDAPLTLSGVFALDPLAAREPGGQLALSMALHDTAGGLIEDDRIPAHKAVYSVLDLKAPPNAHVEIIVYTPPGIEARGLFNNAEEVPTSTANEGIVHRYEAWPDYVLLEVETDDDGTFARTIALIPHLEGAFVWPAAYARLVDYPEIMGWDRMKTVKIAAP